MLGGMTNCLFLLHINIVALIKELFHSAGADFVVTQSVSLGVIEVCAPDTQISGESQKIGITSR